MSVLLAALEVDPPIVEDVALAIALDEYPRLDTDGCRRELDEMAAAIPTGGDLEARVAALTGHVYGELGFRGNADDYYDPRNSYLNEVLARRKGIPISLAVVLMAIGRRLDLEVEGIGFPGHFLVRVGGLYLDPFSQGHLLRRPDLDGLARRFLGSRATLAEAHLEPVDARSMAVRMLFNLQQIYERRGDHPRALVVCDRLVDLSDAPFHRRDRGIHALALGAKEVAREDLAAYLDQAPEADDAARIRKLLYGVGRDDGSAAN